MFSKMRKFHQLPNTFLARLFLSFFAITLSTNLQAGETLPEIIATLSEEKARAEGRASLYQTCVSKRAASNLPQIITKFDDARNPYNGWIDGFVVAVKYRRQQGVDEFAEATKLTVAQRRIDDFVRATDLALSKSGCPAAYKTALLGKVIEIAAPEIVKLLFEHVSKLTEKSKELDEIIRMLESKKIVEWNNVKAFLVFDWTSDRFYNPDEISLALTRKGGSSIYVNKWALPKKPSEFLLTSDKELPQGLSDSYQTYAGPPAELPKILFVTKPISAEELKMLFKTEK